MMRLAADISIDLDYRKMNFVSHSNGSDIGFLCGQLYELTPDKYNLIAAPIMTSPKYLNQPIYFSDLIVARYSNIQVLEDIQYRKFVYNEVISRSGYTAPLKLVDEIAPHINILHTLCVV